MIFLMRRPTTRVTRRFLNSLACRFMTLLFVAAFLGPAPARAAEIEISRVTLENADEGYKLGISFAFDLPRTLEDAIMRGFPLYFTTDVELTRPRWYWFDEKAITASRTVRISYNLLTQQYHAAISDGLHQSFSTLEDAMSLVKRPGRWLIADRGVLKPGEVYNVAVRMGLDVARLPKPFQVHAINSSDWRFSSDWKQFNFKAE